MPKYKGLTCLYIRAETVYTIKECKYFYVIKTEDSVLNFITLYQKKHIIFL